MSQQSFSTWIDRALGRAIEAMIAMLFAVTLGGGLAVLGLGVLIGPIGW
jgi:uncharacterized membrane protein YgaE (UPF0421/DUF939 family)